MRTLLSICALMLTSGCQLTEIRGSSETGVEYRHSGNSNTNADRYSYEQSIDFKWDNDITTSATYRRRDTDDGNGDNDNGMWFQISYPIWKRPEQPDPNIRKIAQLERRIAELERQNAAQDETQADAQTDR